jgi:uncharacterized membrane protein YdbT with pleckstrin-like domain
MTYIEQGLTANENILYKISYFWLARWEVWALFIMSFFIGAFFNEEAGLIIFVYAGYRHLVIKTTERAVTNVRIIQKKGIVSRTTEEIKFDSIETVTVHQSIIERLLDTGTVCVTGRGGISINLSNLDDPLTVKKEIDKIYLK